MKKIPFSLTLARGAIGKKFVVKHYRKVIVITKYPNMKNIIASTKQQNCRQLFKDASAHALKIIRDKQLREEFILRRGKVKDFTMQRLKSICSNRDTILMLKERKRKGAGLKREISLAGESLLPRNKDVR